MSIEKIKIIEKIIERENLRPMNRIRRLLKDPFRALPFYILATISHIKPFILSFKTLWNTKMTSYLPEGNTFYYYGFCEANLTNFLLRFLKNDNIFVDVGAHIGFYSMLTSEIVGEKGKVYSFEPTPRTFEILEKNCKDLENVKLFNLALSDKKGTINFFDYGAGYSAYNSGHSEGAALLNKKHRKIDVETVELDSILENYGIIPNIIKLDAEGLEYKILKGMKHLLKSKERPLITLEVAGDEKWKENYDNSIRILESNNYKIYEIRVDGLIKHHTKKNSYKYDNLLFIPHEKEDNLKTLNYDNN